MGDVGWCPSGASSFFPMLVVLQVGATIAAGVHRVNLAEGAGHCVGSLVALLWGGVLPRILHPWAFNGRQVQQKSEQQ